MFIPTLGILGGCWAPAASGMARTLASEVSRKATAIHAETIGLVAREGRPSHVTYTDPGMAVASSKNFVNLSQASPAPQQHHSE
jgi:hypothetical protein